MAQLIADGGIEIPAGVTFLVGENGSGKSTLVEAFAEVYPRPGHLSSMVHGLAGPEASVEDSPLRWNIKAVTDRMASPAGFFLRAESMHTFLGERGGSGNEQRVWGDEPLQERSHGESFLAILRMRFAEVGVYFMDEPEAALSFRSCLGLLSLLDTMRCEGSQVVVATHSPLLVTLPGATLLQLDDEGMRQVDDTAQLDLVRSWRDFLEAPERYFRHLFDAEEDDG